MHVKKVSLQHKILCLLSVTSTIQYRWKDITSSLSPSQAVRDPLFWKKKKEKKKKIITYLYQGSCLHILEAENGLFAFK